jgi:dTDP-4-amino-4,6-dideoxygalactose transaminase
MPDIGECEISEVLDSLRAGWLTTGKKVTKFEELFAEYVGAQHAIAVNSATSGLHLALEAVGVRAGDRVITTPYTYAATAAAVAYLGADPVFVDVNPLTLNIDPAEVAKVLDRDSAKAILPVDFAGQSCELGAIKDLADRHDVEVVEDAAHALPATAQGQMIGSLGHPTVFSFYASKTITTGEGGMIVTDVAEQADRMRTLRVHGISTDVTDRYTTNKPKWYYEVVALGYKYNMTDIAAAIGIQQLRRADEFWNRRCAIAQQYSESFDGLPLRLPGISRPSDRHAWHLYVIQLETEQLSINRDHFIEEMYAAGIGTSVHFIPLHLHPYWRERYSFEPDAFPVACDAYKRAVSLPIYPRMSDTDVQRVVDNVRAILLNNRR